MKENYQSWDIDISEFPKAAGLADHLKFLIGFAILAPSGHNSQPWEFSIKENTILVWANQERALTQSDPTRRQLLISIGCAIENLLIAGDYYGFISEVRYLPDSNNKDLIAEIIFKSSGNNKNNQNHLISYISKRRTNRNKYHNKLPPQEFISQIQKLSGNEFQITVVTEPEKKDLAADLAILSQIEVMDNPAFREELSHYIKSDFTNHKTGMPGFTLGIPKLVSLFAHELIKKINLSKKSKNKDEALLKKHTPVFVIISAKDDSDLSRIKSGQLFERLWLMAEQVGLSCAPLAAPVQVSDYYKHLQKILGISYRPEVFFRLGHAVKSARHSPRLSIKEAVKS